MKAYLRLLCPAVGGRGCLSYLSGVKKTVLVPVRVLSLIRRTAGAHNGTLQDFEPKKIGPAIADFQLSE